MARGVRVDINIDRAKTKRMLNETAGAAVRRAAQKTAGRARNNIVRSNRWRTGRMHDSVQSVRIAPQTYRVFSNVPYAHFQEYGIGPVYPKRAKALRFKPKGSNVYVFAQRTRGFEGAYFLTKAYRAIKVEDFLP